MEKPLANRFSYFSSRTQSVDSSPTWEGLLLHHTAELPLSEEKRQPNGDVWWLDVYDATQQDVEAVADAFNIHPLTAEDVAMRETREKVEVFRTYYFISFRTLVSDAQADGYPSSAELYILVFYNGAVTFSPQGCRHVDRVRNRIRKMQDPAALSSDWICYALMYAAASLFALVGNADGTATTSSTASNRSCARPNSRPKRSRTRCLSRGWTTPKC